MSVTERRRGIVVAIDGPAGVGKSTTARLVAQKLGYTLVDTGAIYRALAFVAREQGIDWEDASALAKLARDLQIDLSSDQEGKTIVRAAGRDISNAIRSSEMSMGASTVSRQGPVREALLDLQRKLGGEGGVVLEGRDIGTVVFPDAEVKVFLTASAEIRAQRRTDEMSARGETVSYEDTLRETRARDHQDETRAVAPLRPAGDAVVVDSSEMSIDEVVSRITALVQAE